MAEKNSKSSKDSKKGKLEIKVEPARLQVQEDAFAPLVDIYEDAEGQTVLVAEVPGAAQESIDIRVEKGVLSLSADGRREEPDESYNRTYSGFVSGQYFQAFALSDEIDREKVQASLNDGVLVIRLPRAAAARTKKIEITDG